MLHERYMLDGEIYEEFSSNYLPKELHKVGKFVNFYGNWFVIKEAKYETINDVYYRVYTLERMKNH